MSTRESLGRKDLMALTGMDNVLATFWLREGLLQGDGAKIDPGKRLRFPYYEANIIAILLHLREGGIAVETLKAIANIYREAIAWAARLKISDNDVRRLWNALQPQNVEEVLDYTLTMEIMSRSGVFGSDALDARLRRVAFKMDQEQFARHRESFLQITSQPDELSYRVRPTFFWRGPDGWKARISGNDLPTGPRQDGVFTTIAVDVEAITYSIWNDPLAAFDPSRPSTIDLKPAR